MSRSVLRDWEKSGTAEYMVDGEKFEVDLGSFEDFERIGKMIEKANMQGLRAAAISMRDTVNHYAHERCSQLSNT